MTSEKMIQHNTYDENPNLDALISMAEERGFEVQQNKDYGAGLIDLVCKINIHPSLPSINCGFIILKSEEGGGSKDSEDNQFSLRKIEEAIIRGIRSGLDKVYLVASNEEMAKSISGKIERYSRPKGERSKKESKKTKDLRESLLDRYSRPKGQRKKMK